MWGGGRGFFTEESKAIATRRKSTSDEEHFLSACTARSVPFMLLEKWNQGLRLQLLIFHLPPALSHCPPQPFVMITFNVLLCHPTITCHHITSTKNSPALPTAIRRDWRDAVSSGGTEASSLPCGAPGAAVDKCAGCGGRPGGPYTRPGP